MMVIATTTMVMQAAVKQTAVAGDSGTVGAVASLWGMVGCLQPSRVAFVPAANDVGHTDHTSGNPGSPVAPTLFMNDDALGRVPPATAILRPNRSPAPHDTSLVQGFDMARATAWPNA